MKLPPKVRPLPGRMLAIGSVWCLCIGVAAAQPATPTPLFQRCPGDVPVTATTKPDLRALVAAGYDSVGNPVLAAVDNANNQVVILHTNRGGFAVGDCNGSVVQSAISVLANATALDAADLDGDGYVDVAVGVSSGVQVLRNDGTGSFKADAAALATSSPVTAVAVNKDGPPDINLDGPADVAVGTLSGDVFVLFGTTSLLDSANAVKVGSVAPPVGFLVVKDLNRDGYPDIAVGTSGAGGVSAGEVAVFLQDSAQPGSFLPKFTVWTGNSPTSLAADTFTLAALPDLVITTGVPAQVMIFPATGQPGASAGSLYSPTPIVGTPASAMPLANPVALAADDFNGDGKLDIALANKDEGTVSFFLGDGKGGMTESLGVCLVESAKQTPPARCTVGGGPTSLALAMVDLDGRNDVVTANEDDGSFSFLLSGELQPFPSPIPPASPTPTATPPPTPGGDCCIAHDGPGCGNPACQECVTGASPFSGGYPNCLTLTWDATCAAYAAGACADSCRCGTPTFTPTITPTSVDTPSPTPTETPSSCCQCDQQNGCGELAAGGSCPVGCTPVPDASCLGGQCVPHTVAPTLTVTPPPPSGTPTLTPTTPLSPTLRATDTSTPTPAASPEICCQCNGGLTCAVAIDGSCAQQCTPINNASCVGECVTHTPTQLPTPTPTLTPSITALPTLTGSPTPTPPPTMTATPTMTISPTALPQCYASGLCVQGQSCAVEAGGSASSAPWVLPPLLVWLWRWRRR